MKNQSLNNKNMDVKMEVLGLVNKVCGGLQIDISVCKGNVANGFFNESSLCDHNCRIFSDFKNKKTKTGNYECPSALTKHQGLKLNTIAPSHLLIKGINKVSDGIRMANQSILKSTWLKKYYGDNNIPLEVQKIIESMLKGTTVEVNLFGGNPELHPKITDIIKKLKEKGFIINFTTTGFRFMRDPKFLSEIVANPPHLVALSTDDFKSVSQVKKLAKLTRDEIKNIRMKTPMVYGQLCKAYEAVYVGKLSEEIENFPRFLFNLVVHPGNIGYIEELITCFRKTFPKAIVNPYLAQSSFSEGKPVFQKKHLPLLEKFIDNRIKEHLDVAPGVVRRVHYYFMLKAVFETYRKNPAKLLKRLAGYDVWKCYTIPAASRYVKVGASPSDHKADQIAGGHLACFWNPTVITNEDQVWNMKTNKIADYILGDITKQALINKQVCPGCIMPRLNFDQLSLELGMNPEIKPKYLKLRKHYIGF